MDFVSISLHSCADRFYVEWRIEMNTSIKIVLFHTAILATQAFYMYLSNKEQMLKRWYLYVLIMPFVLTFPVILNKQSPYAYDLYEYAIMFCIFTAAILDTIFAIFNKEYMADERVRRFQYTYFFICMAVACNSGISSWLRAINLLALIGSLCLSNVLKKQSPYEILKSLPLAVSSYVCSYAFLFFIG